MPEEEKHKLRLEIAHVLFIDIVGYSKLLINEQSEVLHELNDLVRETERVREADAAGKLIRLPAGDGMALVFRDSPESAAECALEIARALKTHPDVQVRMGIHSGPVNEIRDVNERVNIAGAGINIAQRVMDCGDAGHILLSNRVADDLAQYRHWQPLIHDLGECEVKHGVVVAVANLFTDEVGNASCPKKLQKPVVTELSSPSPTARRWMFIGGGVLLLLLLLLGLWSWQRNSSPPVQPATQPAPAEKRIAVLPFKPLVPENRDQVLEIGMADSLITKLSGSREIIVTSLPSVRKYGDLDQDPIAAGRELRVNSVLEGTVQRSGDHIRVTARLLNVSDGASLWASTFEENFTDVFTVQETISRKVADALALSLSGEEKKRLAKRETENVGAYQLYLTGRYHWSKLTPPDIRKAVSFFQQAIDLDPGYATAYFGLAEANRSLAITADVPSKDCLPLAIVAAKKALEIDDSLAEAHASLSFSLAWYNWDWAGAEKESKRAIALNPNSAHVHFAYAHVLSILGRHDEAIAHIARARALDPVFLIYHALEGMFLHHARRDDEALARLQKAIELDQNFWVTHLILGRVYTQQRKYPEAIIEFGKARELSHGNSETIASIGYVNAMQGDKAKANAVLDKLRNSGHYIPPVNLALVYNALKDQNEAIAQLERACDERDVHVTLLKVDPRWDSLRSNPRFVSILKRIGLD